MLKNRILFLALGTAMVSIGVAFFLWPRSQPSWSGLTLESWLQHYMESDLKNPESKETEVAADAIRAIGSEGFLHLMAWMEYEETTAQRTKRDLKNLAGLLPYAARNKIVEHLDRPKHRARMAEHAFKALGSQGSNAVPSLIQLLLRTNTPDTSLRASLALSYIGEPAVPALIRVVSSERLPNRDLAVHAFAEIDAAQAAEAVPMLVQCLDEPDPFVVEMAALALGHLNWNRTPSFPSSPGC